LGTIDKLQRFSYFVAEGMDYIRKHGAYGKETLTASSEEIELSPERLQLFKEIQVDLDDILREMKTGSRDGTVFDSSKPPPS
jgi:hypothetical protein